QVPDSVDRPPPLVLHDLIVGLHLYATALPGRRQELSVHIRATRPRILFPNNPRLMNRRGSANRIIERLDEVEPPGFADLHRSLERVHDDCRKTGELQQARNLRGRYLQRPRDVVLRLEVPAAEPARIAHTALVGTDVRTLTILNIHRNERLSVGHLAQ